MQLTLFVSILLAGVAVACAILGLVLLLLVMNLVYLVGLAWLFIDQRRTGNSWNVPYPAQPEHYDKRS